MILALKLFAGRFLSFLGKLNIWQLLCIVLAVFAAFQTLRVKAEQRHSAKLERQIVKLADEARAAKERLDAAGARIAEEIRKRTDAENRRIAAGADALRLSGPGRARAACPPAAAGGYAAPGGAGNAASTELSAGDGAVVPWPWLVSSAEQSDLNRAEVIAWREWHRRLVAEWKPQ